MLTATYRELVDEGLWTRLTNRIARDEGVGLAEAEEIMEEALEFLKRCADNDTEQPLVPSPKADIGWHTFILYTREYHTWCFAVAGHFLHHSPTDEPTAAATCGPDKCSCDPDKCCNYPNP